MFTGLFSLHCSSHPERQPIDSQRPHHGAGGEGRGGIPSAPEGGEKPNGTRAKSPAARPAYAGGLHSTGLDATGYHRLELPPFIHSTHAGPDGPP
ncbi:hypothetical protein EYF80_059903 [Liparis tanakae]|uniref:Uncharacterized protein n=1 Tax=Liparis tanakae TaxID=230148 RepID=A0A4Z2ELW5_9TELE|nr:hypothetical protein EYF80_059903 [Liparis tanakae]